VSRAARASAVAAFFALMLVGVLVGGNDRDLTATSFGKVPQGHGAVYDLLRELGLDAARSFAPLEELPPERAVWWIAPDGGCEAPSLAGAPLRDFVSAGGRALVLLPTRLSACPEGATLAGLALPPREGGEEESEDEEAGEAPAERSYAEGPLLRAPRALELPAPVRFAPESAWSEEVRSGEGRWEVAATLGQRPFALSRVLGAGRLVVFAEGRFLENAWLDRGDAAPLTLDLALALGPPLFDERSHGIVPSRSTLGYLARSPALLCFAGLALLGLCFAWYGAAEPPRAVADLDPSAPTLESYVQSLAGFYAATGDHVRVLERYRELTARRLRRHFGLREGAPLTERLARRRGLSREGLAQLASHAPVASAAELASAAAQLDRLVEEAAR
jgi:uncharacterized protein DUF4350